MAAIVMRSSFHDLQCWVSPGDTRPAPIDGVLRKLLDSYDDYLALFPSGERAAWVRGEKARRLAQCNR